MPPILFCSIPYVLPCEATLRPTRANPAHPRGGGILSFAIASHAIHATLFFRFDQGSTYAPRASAVNSTTPGPPVRCTPRPGSVGHLEAPPGPGRTPFRGPHDYALHDPTAPPGTLLAALIEATGRWPASRARPTDLTGRIRGVLSNAKPRRALPNYGHSHYELDNAKRAKPGFLGGEPTGAPRTRVRAHRSEEGSCERRELCPTWGGKHETERVTTLLMYPDGSWLP